MRNYQNIELSRKEDLAMDSNFKFLEKDFPVLANFGNLAEKYCYTDPNSCLMKLGMIGETIVNLMFTYDKIPMPYDNTAVNRINILFREGFLTKDLTDILHALRKVRNKAAHENYGKSSECSVFLQMTYSISEWFMQTYGDWNYQHKDYIMPVEDLNEKQTQNIVSDKEKEKEKEDKLTKEALNNAEHAKKVDKKIRLKQANRVANQRQKSEAETRYMIDEQLRQVGWEADTEQLRYSKGIRPVKGRNIAIAEWPTNSKAGERGYADYALFIGTNLVGLIEAKAEHKDIPSVIDYQGKDYPRNIRKEDAKYLIGMWGNFKVPFTFATNGRPYIEQFKTKSGIWFLDLRNSSNIPIALHGWISPEGMMDLLEKDIQKGNTALQIMPYDLLKDKDGLNLREYQLEAIKAAENAVINGQKEILIAMATGTGKTRTILGMIYRFLKTDRFKRILFLVDRTSLGDQALDVFKEVKLEELMTLDEIYNIKGLDEKTADKETCIQIATVQSMVKSILYSDGEMKMPSVTDYDLVIIDEAHRGYTLDKEMGDTEVLYRDQRDYQSKYRSVIEYFDAVKIALTATPALQTTEIFGQPVFKYTYREAVIEGYLVDHDAPHHLETKLSRSGIHYKSGDTVTLYDPVTGEIMNSEQLDDELDFDIEKFNKQVITESFNKAVLKEIARDIDPENPEEGKTLIYAVDDKHADMIVNLLREIYSETDVDNEAIMKITGKAGEGNPKKVKEKIKRFKNERYPSIAVTVDLLTTGIDVPEITTLVFMRRVKSRILFEQMMGRATRLCNKIHKTHFDIYDPVGVYDSLEPVNTMKPVVVNPSTTFIQLLDGLEQLNNKEEVQAQINQIIAKLQRKKRNMNANTIEQFASMTDGMEPSEFIIDLQKRGAQDAKERVLKYRKTFDYIQQVKSGRNRKIVISDKEDELKEHTRGYGNSKKPEDYLDAFSEYVQSHMNEIAALNIVCTKPKELTRESLKALRLALDREGFTEQQLNTAVSELKNEEIAADIISLIRRYAIGSALISHEARIRKAVEKLKKAHRFSKQEMNWIKRIEKYLMEESVLNVQVFDEDSRFKNHGGFTKINKIFQNELENIVLELNEYLYDDGGRAA